MKIFILATATALGFAAAASADEFRLDAASMDSVTAGGTVAFDTNILKTVDIDKTVDLTVNKTVTSTVSVTGNLATAEGSADSVGFFNNLAETDTFAQVQPGGAFSFSESLAAGSDATGGGGGL